MSARKTDWSLVADQLAQRVPRSKLHEAVVDWVEKTPVRTPWAVAFSGGADSLALLLLLWAHWPERRLRLKVLHFNHRLRGLAANGDEAFCKSVCKGLGLSCTAGRWADAGKKASEADARNARFGFFQQAMQPSRTWALWLGHHQDDIIETMLMRLARGSGTRGLAAPRPVQRMTGRRVHLRPLLALKKAEIMAVLRESGAIWRLDSSNAGSAYLRNRLRRSVVPAWKRAAGDRDVLAGVARARELLEEDDQALETWIDELQLMAADGRLNLNRLAGKPRGVMRRALHRWLLALREPVDISRQAFKALLESIEKGKDVRHSLSNKGFAVIRSGRLGFEAGFRARSK